MNRSEVFEFSPISDPITYRPILLTYLPFSWLDFSRVVRPGLDHLFLLMTYLSCCSILVSKHIKIVHRSMTQVFRSVVTLQNNNKLVQTDWLCHMHLQPVRFQSWPRKYLEFSIGNSPFAACCLPILNFEFDISPEFCVRVLWRHSEICDLLFFYFFVIKFLKLHLDADAHLDLGGESELFSCFLHLVIWHYFLYLISTMFAFCWPSGVPEYDLQPRYW